MDEESDPEIQDTPIVKKNVLDYFTIDKVTNKEKCNIEGCNKELTLPINELIARNHISGKHHKEWEALEKNADKQPIMTKKAKPL
ncbi:8018_t:CDS:1, partial [Cetraspora pellucida]